MEVFKNILLNNVLKSLIVIIVAYLIYIIIMFIVKKNMNLLNKKNNFNNKIKTYVKVVGNTIRYSYLVLVVIVLLQINGVNVTAIIAGLGIASIIGGLALQDLLKDIIMGSNIITDDFFVIGDIVEFNGVQGKVINLGLKSTKIEDIYTKNILTITNRNIDKITKISDCLFISVPVSYSEKMEHIDAVFKLIVEEIKNDNKVKSCEYLGLNKFCDSAINYLLSIKCDPDNKLSVNREVLKIIKRTFDENNIEIPFNQLDVHNK